jgi:hypothetical protein
MMATDFMQFLPEKINQLVWLSRTVACVSTLLTAKRMICGGLLCNPHEKSDGREKFQARNESLFWHAFG